MAASRLLVLGFSLVRSRCSCCCSVTRYPPRTLLETGTCARSAPEHARSTCAVMTALLGSIGDDPLRARAVCAPLCVGRPALRGEEKK